MITRALIVLTCGAIGAPSFAAELTEPLELASSGQFQLGRATFSVPGGFFGHKQGHDKSSDTFMLIHDSGAGGKYAVMNVERQTAVAKNLPTTEAHRDALAYVVLGSRLLDLEKQGWTVEGKLSPESRWSVDGIDFFYGSASGKSPKGELRVGFAYAILGDDLVVVELQSPVSMWATTYDEFRSLCFSAKRK